MKKLTFKVSSQKDCSVVSLLKEVNKISCRIYLNLENGFVAVEDVNDTMIDSVIELVDKYYTILGIELDNTFEESTKKQVSPVIAESTADTTDGVVEENVKEVAEVVAEKQPTVLEPQSEDDLIIKKVEFENELVEKHINSFLKTAYWALYNRRATEKDIGEYILTCMSEISMRYSSKPIIEFSVGDIVDVNYGVHLPGEIIGGHVHAIVCNILNNDMVYVVPITKARSDIISQSYLFMDAPQEATYENEFYKGGTVLVDKGKYVRAERFNSVIGRTKMDFFQELLYQLASTFDFTSYFTKTVENDNNLPFSMGEATDEVVETPIVTNETADKAEEAKNLARKAGRAEATLLKTIGFAFDKLNTSKKVEEQVESFLTDIGMTTTEKMVTQSFIIACNIKKINYENVLLELHEQFPKVKEEIIKSILKEAFKNWLEKYPTLAEECPKISLMSVLKVFAKRFA